MSSAEFSSAFIIFITEFFTNELPDISNSDKLVRVDNALENVSIALPVMPQFRKFKTCSEPNPFNALEIMITPMTASWLLDKSSSIRAVLFMTSAISSVSDCVILQLDILSTCNGLCLKLLISFTAPVVNRLDDISTTVNAKLFDRKVVILPTVSLVIICLLDLKTCKLLISFKASTIA